MVDHVAAGKTFCHELQQIDLALMDVKTMRGVESRWFSWVPRLHGMRFVPATLIQDILFLKYIFRWHLTYGFIYKSNFVATSLFEL